MKKTASIENASNGSDMSSEDEAMNIAMQADVHTPISDDDIPLQPAVVPPAVVPPAAPVPAAMMGQMQGPKNPALYEALESMFTAMIELLGGLPEALEFLQKKAGYVEERINHTSGDRFKYWNRLHNENMLQYKRACSRMHHEYGVHVDYVQNTLQTPFSTNALGLGNDQFAATVKSKVMVVTMEQ